MTRLNRREMLLGLSAACAAPLQIARAAEATVLTAADVHVNGYPTVEAVKWISDRLEKETGGRLRIRLYHSGQLGRELDTVDLARFGALDMTRVTFAGLSNPFPATQLFSLPYVFDSTAHMRRAVDGPVGRWVLDQFSRRGVVGLAIYDAGARSFYNVAHPVHTPDDMRGLKVRVPPSDMFLALGSALGANPTPLPYGEVFSALGTRLIDGAENNWRSFHSSRQFEVAKHWAPTEHSYAPEALLISQQRFESLSASDRELLASVAAESVGFMRALWDKTEAESRATVIAAGVQVSEVDRAAFRRAAEPLAGMFLKDEELQRRYREIRALAD